MEDHKQIRSVQPRELVNKHANIVGFVMKQDQLQELMIASGSSIGIQKKLTEVVGSGSFGK